MTHETRPLSGPPSSGRATTDRKLAALPARSSSPTEGMTMDVTRRMFARIGVLALALATLVTDSPEPID